MAQTQVSGSGIKDNVITNSHLHSAANIAGSKLANSGVTAGSYGSGSATLSLTINAQGLITAASTNSISTDLVNDSSPQLGGNLDTNGRNINVTDDQLLNFGASSDLYIKHSSGHNANFIVSSQGDIEHHMASSKKIIKGFNNSGTPYVALYQDGNKKFETSSSGATITGVCTATSFAGDGSSLSGINTDLVADTSPQLGGLLDGNGQTANFTGNTTGLGLPIGTTGQEPTPSNYKGYIRFNDTDDTVYYCDGTSWNKINAVLCVLNSVGGTLFAGAASNITLSGTGFLASGLVVNFVQSSDGINSNVTVTPSSDIAATVAVPAAVYNNVTAGNAVTIKVTNSDGEISGTVNKTALSLPTGGTVTTYSSGGTNYRVHSFTSSGTFTNTISSLTVTYLIVAGGGGGGSNNDVGGGGGAGGLLQGTSTPSVTGHTITVGAGGAGGCSGQGGGGGCRGSNGGNSSAFGVTANGGGGGGTRYQSGRSGGSGGGGGDGGASGGSGTSGQGHSGGNAPGMDTNNMNDQGAGGGAGGAASSYNPGSGLNVSITGTSVEYARGGTGYNHPQVRQAPANSGDGGRGAYNQSGSLGGSGIVILRYAV